MTAHKKKKIGLLILIAVICAALILLIVFCTVRADPVQYLSVHNQDDPAFCPQEIVCQVETEDNGLLIVFKNQNGSLSCAVLEKIGFLYQITVQSGVITPAAVSDRTVSSQPSVSLCSATKDHEQYLVWGILQNPDVATLWIENQKADIIESDTMRLFFTFIKPKEGSPYLFQYYDSDDNLIA